MVAAEKNYFLQTIVLLRTLAADQKPLWGTMSPQHMVEHVVGSWRISNGRIQVPIILPEDEVAKRREFLFSDTPYPKNLPNPVFKDGQPPLRKPDLAAAIDQLEDEMMAFFEYHEQHPDAIEAHPVFGELDANGWLIFQTKHMGHHLAQFGLQ